MTGNRTHPGISQLPADPHALINAVLTGDRRVLLVGPPGTGKSTLVDGIATTLSQGGRTCRCLGADPGSPLFGVPGAVCLGRREGAAWTLEVIEALCTLDAGRFRLPLVSAIRRLAATVADIPVRQQKALGAIYVARGLSAMLTALEISPSPPVIVAPSRLDAAERVLECLVPGPLRTAARRVVEEGLGRISDRLKIS